MPELSEKCTFNRAWIGVCGKENCTNHRGLQCSNCGNPATHECGETSTLVCGFLLCDDCEHTIRDNGCNAGGNLPTGLRNHCKKTEQIYEPWFAKEACDEAESWWNNLKRPEKLRVYFKLIPWICLGCKKITNDKPEQCSECSGQTFDRTHISNRIWED